MKKLILGTIIATTALTASAGDKGNGGGVHYCPNSEKKIEVYDLYEGRFPKGRLKAIETFKKANGSYEEMYQSAIQKIARYNIFLAHDVNEKIDYLTNNQNFKVLDKKIRITDDADYPWTDEDCTYEPVADWDDSEDFITFRSKLYQEIEKDDLNLTCIKTSRSTFQSCKRNGRC